MQFRAAVAVDINYRPRGGAENGRQAYARAEAGQAFELRAPAKYPAIGEPLNDDELDARFAREIGVRIPGFEVIE